MENLVYRKLTAQDVNRISEMNPAQTIHRAWRDVDGKRQLVEINFYDAGWPNGYEHHLENLMKTITEDGFAVGAFEENDRLIGFASLNRGFFGEQAKYALLDQLFISLEDRGKGIGRKLFSLCADAAREWQADKIYICAGSAEETIAFYFAVGCIEAVEINQALYEFDRRDIQLEFSLKV